MRNLPGLSTIGMMYGIGRPAALCNIAYRSPSERPHGNRAGSDRSRPRPGQDPHSDCPAGSGPDDAGGGEGWL
jgi:hypothetical protein